MKFAFADPPYLGCGKLYAKHHPDALVWDKVETHYALIDRLFDEYPDGWVLSCHEPSYHILRTYIESTGRQCRGGPWVKPFAIFKPNVNPSYSWEPVIWTGGRKFTRADATVKNFVSANITLKRGLTGAKPRDFCRWVISLLNAQPGDQFDDLFPGTGAFTAAWNDVSAAPVVSQLFAAE